MNWIHYFFSWRGRVDRAKYWLFVPIICAMLLVVLLPLSLVMATGLDATANGRITSGIILVVLMACCIYVALAVSAKRLHDRNRTAWWIVPFVFLSSLSYWGAKASLHNSLAQPWMALAWHLLYIALYVLAFVELGCLRGTAGVNRFGPDPLERPQPSLRLLRWWPVFLIFNLASFAWWSFDQVKQEFDRASLIVGQ